MENNAKMLAFHHQFRLKEREVQALERRRGAPRSPVALHDKINNPKVIRGNMIRAEDDQKHKKTRHRFPLRVGLNKESKDEHLVHNKGNKVELYRCWNSEKIGEGLRATGQLPHFCVAGESNAGKSSLLNHLLKMDIVRASSVAGKTRSIDMMAINDRVVLTDLPGLPSRDHQVEKLWKNKWHPLVREYFQRCSGLLTLFYVHDVRWRVTPSIRSFFDEVNAAGIPIVSLFVF